MKIYVKGREINLSKNSFVGQGGEGQIYTQKGIAYKIYLDKNKMIALGKIQELSVLSDPNIIRPQEIFTDKKGIPLGYTMKYVKGGIPVCQLFPKSYRDRNNITHDITAKLVSRLKELVQHCHQKGIFIVDVNELNFLTDQFYQDMYAIDADSYQTSHYPATAIMDSIRDWNSKTFSAETDWYSFGIISFQMFTGLHPFRGKYKGSQVEFKAKVPTDSPDDSFAITRRRMRNNISVFHPEVSVPKAAYPFSVIPSVYKAWYEAMFVNGKRVPPPGSFDAVIVVQSIIRALTGTDNLNIEEIGSFEGTISGIWEQDGITAILSDVGLWINNHRVSNCPSNVTCLGFSAKAKRPVGLVPHAIPELIDLLTSSTRKNIGFGLRADEFMNYDGRIYIKTGDKIMEIVLREVGNEMMATTTLSATVLEHATKMFSGVVIQNLLGSTYSTVFPQTGTTYQNHLEELDEYRVIDAKFDSGVMMVIGEKKGIYDKFVFRFSSNYSTYDVRVVKDVPLVGLNFVTLDTGVVVCLNENEQLEVFSSREGSSQMKVIDDKVLGGDMLLSKQNGKVTFARGNKLYRLSMK